MPSYEAALRRTGRERYQQLIRRVRRVFRLPFLAMSFATAGLYLLDDPGQAASTRLLNAVWNAANTVTTLGDYCHFDLRQKLFIPVFMSGLLVVGAHSISSLAGILSLPEVTTFRENRRMEKTLAKLSGHVIVAGYGEVGAIVASRLRDRGETVLVIDAAAAIAQAASEAGHLVVQGMAEHDETLQAARIDSAKAMLIEVASPTASGRNWFAHAGANDVLHIDALIADAVVDRYARGSATPDRT